jgi:hypothetical protein
MCKIFHPQIAQIKMNLRWRLRNLPGLIPVVMYAKFVPICLRQRLAGDDGYIPPGAADFGPFWLTIFDKFSGLFRV